MPAENNGSSSPEDVVQVVLSVDPTRFAQVVAAARRAGLAVDDEWPAVGSLSGRLESRLLPALREVDGVELVEVERFFQLRPPDSGTQ